MTTRPKKNQEKGQGTVARCSFGGTNEGHATSSRQLQIERFQISIRTKGDDIYEETFFIVDARINRQSIASSPDHDEIFHRNIMSKQKSMNFAFFLYFRCGAWLNAGRLAPTASERQSSLSPVCPISQAD
jgi:hypothetical protein